tara:strand:- start:10799 stop:12001 length:1203 start_codon:yes stop_codon:yes gene_type:complete
LTRGKTEPFGREKDILIGLKQFATDKQKMYVDNVVEFGSANAAAKHLGVNESTVRGAIKSLKNAAARKGYSPEHDMTSPTADGFKFTGQSVLRDSEGNIKLKWEKTSIDHERQLELMRECIEAMKGDIPLYVPYIKDHINEQNSNLANCHILTDYHLGMMAWHEESGEDWDMKLAEEMIYKWFSMALNQSPNAEVGILANVGDLLHWDGYDAVTPTSKHIVDADTRFQRLCRVAIRVIRRVVDMMLVKYKTVHIKMCDANHDPASESWLREFFHAFYETEPRVEVDTNAGTYYCYEHGLTSLFFHHGHRRKVANVDHVFTAKFREVFGRTKYSYAHIGHLHSRELKETNLMIVEQHRTMAASDAYAANGGWISGREAAVITYHKEFGEVGRISITPEMLK